MTAIVRTRTSEAPPQARVGLVLPGAGHLAVGEVVPGLGLVLLTGLAIGSAVAGFPRLGAVLFSGPAGSLALHPVLAVVYWFVLTGSLWLAAYRRAYPRPLTDEEFSSNQQIFRRTLVRHRTGMVGLFGVLFFISLTFLTPLIAPFDSITNDVGPPSVPPNWDHWMGTDKFGRDMFSRLLYGSRISLPIGFVAVGIAATLGTTLGAVAAFVGGVVDNAIMFVVDGLLALPRLVLLIALVGLYQEWLTGSASIFLIVVILGFTAWMGIARIVRSEVLSLKEREFVIAARALGLSRGRILFRHLIPNALAPVIVYCSLAIGSTMLAEASLSFLGLGVQPPISTWGVMVNEGKDVLRGSPWISLFPGLAITLAVLSFNLLGDGLRDATDPRLRGTK